MSVVEIKLTADQLAAAYTQLSAPERQSFLTAIFDHPAQSQAALELLVEARAAMRRKFSPRRQRLLDSLLDKNAGENLHSAEREQLDELMSEYGAGLVDKARAKYILHLMQQITTTDR